MVEHGHSASRGEWKQDECYLAVWIYDQIDRDPNQNQVALFEQVAKWTGRTIEEVEERVRTVAACEGRPATEQPLAPSQNIRGYTRRAFADYWVDRVAARGRLQDVVAAISGRELPIVLNPPAAHVDEGVASLVPQCMENTNPDSLAADEREDSNPRELLKTWVLDESVERERWERIARLKAMRKPSPGLRDRSHFHPAMTKYPERIREIGDLAKGAMGSIPSDSRIRSMLSDLRQTARQLQAATSFLRVPPPPDPYAIERARKRWLDSGTDISRLDRATIRLLCMDPQVGLNPEWLEALLKFQSESRIRRAWIEALLAHYVSIWRGMPDPERVEAALVELVTRVPKSEAWSGFAMQAVQTLVGPEAPRALMTGHPAVWEAAIARLQQWHVPVGLPLGQASLAFALKLWENAWQSTASPQGEEAYRSLLHGLLNELLHSKLIPLKAFLETTSFIILSERMVRFPPLRDTMMKFCLADDRLGDPRLHKQNWAGIAAARDRLMTWLAGKNLRLFYDAVVKDHQDDQGRKAFWLQYVDQVADFRLVLCDEDERRLKARLGDERILCARMEGSNRTSAFLMRFVAPSRNQDFICVEFSQTGNSLYIYNTTTFQAGIGRLEALDFRIGSEPRNLKNKEYVMWDPIRHIGDWQSRVAFLLHQWGIRTP